MFQAAIFPEGPDKGAAKEVALYRDTLKCGWNKMAQSQGLLTNPPPRQQPARFTS
jgi:hypothetical protein